MNTILISILLRNKPDEVKLLLVDPKTVELVAYNDLPHLVTPVINDPQLASEGLKWACEEMDRRYAVMANAGSREIDDYNRRNPNNRLPKIVLVIDEMADMMESVYKKQVESNIVRLAQKARACGIHMVLATQRPTVKVISGQIKANVPARVCLSVMSRTDSMVVLDQIGAEMLQGHGDMLYLDGMNNRKPQRLQGGLITDSEICNVVMDLRLNNQPDDLQDINLADYGLDLAQYYGRH
jgi:S-DNA-T family DNA segregation ATPase FtsK/SpoIIIE